MSGPWSRWSVYEYMKRMYMTTGQAPSQDELKTEFEEIDSSELLEGIAEFETVICVKGGAQNVG